MGADETILQRLVGENGLETLHNGIIAALCEGWPDSNLLQEVFELEREDKLHPNPLSQTTYTMLVCRKSQSQVVFDMLREVLEYFEYEDEYTFRFVVRPIIRRFREDAAFVQLVENHLLATPTSSEKATLPRLLKAAGVLSDKVRKWCLEELERQSNVPDKTELGIDLLAYRVQPVAYSLLEVLSGNTGAA